MTGSKLSLTETRELARILNRARSVKVLRGGLQVDCRTPEDRERAFALLEKQGRHPQRFNASQVVCAAEKKEQ